MNSDLKITLSRVLEKPLQINGTDTETHYINELFKRLVFHELLNKLNLKNNYNYHIRYRTQRLKIQNQIEQESQQLIKNLILSNQINQITSTQIKIQF